MKKLIVMFALLAVLTLSCDIYRVIQRDPAVLNSSVQLSGEVTGDIVPEIRTMRMHVTGQARNYLLVEVYGMETYQTTQSVTLDDSLSYTRLYLSIVDEGPVSNERCYRNMQFWVGPFERDEYYTLHLSEAESAFQQDELVMTFSYDQSIDSTISAGDHYYLLSDIPFDTVSVSHYEGNDVPDFDYTSWGYRDTLRFFDTDSGLLIRSILEKNSSVTHDADYEIVDDTLVMNITLGPAGVNDASKKIFFDYLIPNYEDQIFYYKFNLTNSDWSMFEGFYNLP